MTKAQEIKSRIISLVLTLCVLVLALYVFSTSTAWFTENKSTEIGAIGITTELPDAVESAYYYRGTGMGVIVDELGGRHNQYHFSYDPAVLNTQTVITGTDASGNVGFGKGFIRPPRHHLVLVLVQVVLLKDI